MNILLKVCLSARIRRDEEKKTEANKVVSSSEESSEDLDKILANASKILNEKEKDEFSKIVTDLKSAKGLESQLDGIVRNEFTFGFSNYI